jgi:DNA-binding MarR family transcriptional regulator
MSIIRSKYTPENSTVISKNIFKSRLSAESLAILVFLLGYSDAANPQPMDLEESALAEEFSMSIKAVRKFLGQLQERGYVVRQPNGRFILPASTIAENTLYLTAAEMEDLDSKVANQH